MTVDSDQLSALSDTRRAARMGLWVLALGLGAFLAWAALAPLDEGVPSSGQVSLDTKRKAVQHQTGGTVKRVHVREGQSVQEGQLLLELDDTVARSTHEALRQHYLGLRATQGRLVAEQAEQADIRFHADVQAAATEPLVKAQLDTQRLLFASRRSALRAELAAIEESVHGLEASVQAVEVMLNHRRMQHGLLSEELRHTREMVREGYAPRNRQLELERMVAESNASVADLTGNASRARRAILEARQKAIARQQEYRKEVSTQLAEVSRDAETDVEKLVVLKLELDRVAIRAPAAGQVVGLAVQSVGAVVQAGQKLADVVPAGEDLLLESRIAPHLIDKVHAGLLADVRFSTFAHTPQLVAQGKVVSVSGDLLTDPQNPQISYYLARVALTTEGTRALGRHQLQPGMPVEFVIKTGERSLLTYLLHPLTKRLAASMKEE